MNDWVLIVALMSPGGDFLDKVPVIMPDKASCVKARKELPKVPEHPLGIKVKGVCVTMAHWTGKAHDKGMALD